MQIVEKVRPDGSKRVAVSFAGMKSRTKQSEKRGADINLIVARYKKTGLLVSDLEMASRKAVFGNFENAADFHGTMSRVAMVEQAFEQLPSGLRKRFDHDAGKYLDWICDPKNTVEAIKLGLLPRDRSAVRYVDRVSGKVSNILGQVVGHLNEKGEIVEDNPAPVAPGAGSAPAGDKKPEKVDHSSAL